MLKVAVKSSISILGILGTVFFFFFPGKKILGTYAGALVS